MAHRIIENNKEAFIILEGEITPEDAMDYRIFELFDKNVKKTLDISKVNHYNVFVVGYIELCNQLGITIKERTKNGK